jgi:hypothetical protein
MAKKIGNWLIGTGCCIAFLGLCALPAAFGANSDKTLAGVGMTILSTGIMLIAGGALSQVAKFRGSVCRPD